ncbi:MAG: hypothetical protein QM802_22365 [Agriterribacter sp.]
MSKTQLTNLSRLRLIITVIIIVLTLGWLTWVHFHGGVPSHHMLDQNDLPAISNWWSGLLLPVLAWILLGKIKTRIEKQTEAGKQYKSKLVGILVRFIIGLFLGIILSVSFTYNFKPFLDNVLYLLLLLSFILPIFFSECMLGFVLGMTYTFGAILPTAFILIMAAIGFLIYRFIRPLIIRLIKNFGNKTPPGTNQNN